MADPNSAPTFEIGLVMAGAISAGAYTAGVIDFLIQALDEWEKAKEYARKHPDDPKSVECPMHEVKIKVMAGSSAGGMTAGLATGQLGLNFQSVTAVSYPPAPAQEPKNNNLYKSWVNEIDIDPLLGLNDLAEDDLAPVQSVLDSTVLRDIADNAFQFERPDDRTERPYVAESLHVFLTVTNLRGVPYALDFVNQKDARPYEMTMHADSMHFILSKDEPKFVLRLKPSLNDVNRIPTEGKYLIIVAAVNNVLHFRIFDGDGKKVVDTDEKRLTEQARQIEALIKEVVDTDEKRLTEQARQIEALRKQLESFWPPHELTRSDTDKVINAVTSIVGYPPPTEEAFWLKPYGFADPTNRKKWEVLQTSALATGAFPIGLAPRLVKRPPAQYAARKWPVSTLVPGTDYFRESLKPIPPTWPEIEAAVTSDPCFEYQSLCVDGGVMNNEPLELARRVLAGPGGSNPRGGDQASRAVIMILPFPNAGPYEVKYDGGTNLFRLLATTFNSLIAQARFNPEELALACDPNVYSRFLIVPRRGLRPDGRPEPNTIACGSLGGFGGFLSRAFREHDYQLGRRNCQWFLKQYFVLPYQSPKDPERNKLFDSWTHEARATHQVHRAGWGQDGAHRPAPGELGEKLPFLPIIPLVGEAASTVRQPLWPEFTRDEFKALLPKVRRRLDAVARALVNQNLECSIATHVLNFVWRLQRKSVIDRIMNAIRDDLTARKLMR